MAVRNKRRCRNCPEQEMATAAQQAQVVAQPTPVLQITSESEGARLWTHALFGTGACIGMLEGYQRWDMPGFPVEGIKALVTRMQEVLKILEAKNVAQPTPEQTATEDGGDDGRVRRQAARRSARREAHEERPSEQTLSAENVVNDEQDAE